MFSCSGLTQYSLGVMLIFVVVIMWVSSSALTQYTFKNMSFNSPYFLTYFSTSLFIVYLPMILVRNFLQSRGYMNYSSTVSVAPSSGAYSSIGDDSADIGALDHQFEPQFSPVSTRHVQVRPLFSIVDDEPSRPDDAENLVAPTESALEAANPANLAPLTVKETARYSLIFGAIWFAQNYTFNASLSMTSVSSNTILSSTSSLFTMVWSVACLGDGLKIIDFFAVLASMAGVFLVSLKDWGTGSDTGYGDLLGLVSACVYGLYTTFLKRVIGDDSRVDMLLFFGFLGLFNTLIMWIFIPILNITNIEPFHWPSWHVLAFLSLNGVLSVLSDYCWARSILLTSPLMANIGLSLAVPLSMLYDFIFNGLDFTFSYLFGSLLVLVGFALINASFVGEDNDLREVVPQPSPVSHASSSEFNFVDSAAAPNVDQSLARMAQAGAATASYEISSAAKSEYEVRAEIGEEFRLEPVV